MNLPQDQIVLLHHKIDLMYQMIEQLSDRLSSLLSGQQSVLVASSKAHTQGMTREYRSGSITSSFDDEMVGHKDVIAEPNHIESDRSTGDQPLTSEVQVQRLTAQLTAAYNRIAALEEQLLSHRIH